MPLAFGSGATWILAQFKESLPQFFYLTFLYLIWSFLVVVRARLVVRLVFGDLPARFMKWVKHRREQSLTFKLPISRDNKVTSLSNLIVKIIEEKVSSEIIDDYFRLHFWFIDNRSKFLAPWYTFSTGRTNTAHESEYWSSTAELGYKVFRDNYRDPFSYFYEPVTVEILRAILSRESANKVGFVLVKLNELTFEFVRWVKSE